MEKTFAWFNYTTINLRTFERSGTESRPTWSSSVCSGFWLRVSCRIISWCSSRSYVPLVMVCNSHSFECLVCVLHMYPLAFSVVLQGTVMSIQYVHYTHTLSQALSLSLSLFPSQSCQNRVCQENWVTFFCAQARPLETRLRLIASRFTLERFVSALWGFEREEKRESEGKRDWCWGWLAYIKINPPPLVPYWSCCCTWAHGEGGPLQSMA